MVVMTVVLLDLLKVVLMAENLVSYSDDSKVVLKVLNLVEKKVVL
jgi:hypothetical protein